MIIGNGLIANKLKDLSFCRSLTEHKSVFFASGVSNSKETRPAEFQRELELLSRYTSEPGQLVYFGTCSIFDPSVKENPYINHKLSIEESLSQRPNTLVIRLPNVVSRKASANTLIKHLYQLLINGDTINVWQKATRSLIHIDEVGSIVTSLAERLYGQNNFINVCAPQMISIIEILEIMQDATNIKAKRELVDKGACYSIDTTRVIDEVDNYHDIFNDNYYQAVLKKFCEEMRLYEERCKRMI